MIGEANTSARNAARRPSLSRSTRRHTRRHTYTQHAPNTHTHTQRSFGGYAYFLGLDRRNGNLRWGTQADPNIAAVVTTSPALYRGMLYGGVSSLEENVASREPPARPRVPAAAAACRPRPPLPPASGSA